MNWLAESMFDDDSHLHRQPAGHPEMAKLREMQSTAMREYTDALQPPLASTTDIAYRKGKLTAIQEVIEMLLTGEIPT